MRFALAFILALVCGAAAAVDFSGEEKARILQHGPWPPPRAAGDPAAIALGERLFYEPRLSGTGSVLCATCHVPYRSFQDGRELAFGLELTARNTPSLINVGLYSSLGWEGRQHNLGAQSIRPMLEGKEMRSTPAHIAHVLRSLYASDYGRAFGRAVPADDRIAMEDAGKALAAFQETLVSGRTPFDEFRDALARGEPASYPYPEEAQRGLGLFVGSAKCSVCHAGPRFTSEARVGGIRIPALREVAMTAPYMHDGRYPTLDEVLRHHGRRLTEIERNELVAFLGTLSEVTRPVVRKDHASRDVRP